MPHASGRFRGKEVMACRLEEFQNRLVLERRRVRHVDDDLSACKRLGQSLTSEDVDARRGGRRHYLMAMLTKFVHELCSDEPATADNHNLHAQSPGLSPISL